MDISININWPAAIEAIEALSEMQSLINESNNQNVSDATKMKMLKAYTFSLELLADKCNKHAQILNEIYLND